MMFCFIHFNRRMIMISDFKMIVFVDFCSEVDYL